MSPHSSMPGAVHQEASIFDHMTIKMVFWPPEVESLDIMGDYLGAVSVPRCEGQSWSQQAHLR